MTRNASVPDEELAARLVRPRDSNEAWREAQDACQQLYQRYAHLLLAFLASRVPRSDLADVHHDIWVRVWERAPSQFDGQHFRGWLYKVARNHLVDRSRRRQPELAEAPDAWAAAEPEPVEVLLDQERRQLLERCLGRLTGELAELVRGRLAGESYPELSERLKIPPARAHRLFHTAKDQLQSCIERSGT